jgi:hypothetical protein
MAGRNMERYAKPMSLLWCPPVSPIKRLKAIDNPYEIATKATIGFVFLRGIVAAEDESR